MKRMAILLALGVLVAAGVVVVRETAGVVLLASSVDPRLGQAVLWGLVAVYAFCLFVPAALFFRLRAPLIPPAIDAGDDALDRYRGRLAARLSRHPLVAAGVTAEPAAIEQAIRTLDDHAIRDIQREAALVFMSTAVSQSGRLDALFVLVVQSRLIWKIGHVYWQRPTLREFLFLYGNVGATMFAAQSLEDMDLVSEVLEPIVASSLEAAPAEAALFLTPIATTVAEALFQGTVNALLTLRVGCIAKSYCRGLPVAERRVVRRAASQEAGAMLPRVIAEPMGKLFSAIGTAGASAVGAGARWVGRAARSGAGAVVDAVRQVNPFRGTPKPSP